MTGPALAQLGYALYTDSGYSLIWDDIGGANVNSGTGNGSAQNYTVYGKIPTGQYLAPGGYTDTVIATVSY
jgi:spore coat protein U-like protein